MVEKTASSEKFSYLLPAKFLAEVMQVRKLISQLLNSPKQRLTVSIQIANV